MPELYQNEQASTAADKHQPSQQTTTDEPKAFNFKLTIEDCRWQAPDKHREYYEPTEAQLIEAINNNKLSEENFFVLESGTPIANCTILQVMGYNNEDNIFDAEIVRMEINNKGKQKLAAYHCDLTAAALLQTMKNFTQRQVPNFDNDSNWYYLFDL